jgi:hypothetical protein
MTFTPATHPLRNVPVDSSMYRNATATIQALQAVTAQININEKADRDDRTSRR